MGLFFRSRKKAIGGYAQHSFKTVESFKLDGLDIARSRHRKRGIQLPIRQFIYLAITILSFKIFLFLNMGAAAYGAKADEFAAGTEIEQVMAWAMRLDPVSQWIVDGLRYGTW